MLTFLRWWFITCFSFFGIAVAGTLGFFPYLWNADVTKLSFAILAIFTCSTIFIGMLTFHARDRDQTFARHLPLCWFTSELMLGLGMIGTLIGFLIMLQGAFGGQLDLTNAANAQKVLSGMALGFATAGLTTLVGLACSLVTKMQLINLEYQLDEQ